MSYNEQGRIMLNISFQSRSSCCRAPHHEGVGPLSHQENVVVWLWRSLQSWYDGRNGDAILQHSRWIPGEHREGTSDGVVDGARLQ